MLQKILPRIENSIADFTRVNDFGDRFAAGRPSLSPDELLVMLIEALQLVRFV